MTPLEFLRDLLRQKTSSLVIVQRCLRHPTMPACDRQADRWTHDDSKYRASIALRW